MTTELVSGLPQPALDLALVLALAFFLGLEREEHKQLAMGYAFGGVRTFPLVGLMSYALALISGAQSLTWAIGFAVVGAFLWLSFQHKLAIDRTAGLTTEVSALATYVLGGLVQHQQYWIATAIGVLSVLLLQLKRGLEGLTRRVDASELTTAAKFLLLAAVILPIVPNEELTRFHINPFKTWLVVVAVSAISFASFVLQRVLKGRGGVVLSAILGGAYSSTLTTIVLSRESKGAERPNLFAGCILTASGVMYGRLVSLLAFFNTELAARLAPAFVGLGALGALAGAIVARRADAAGTPAPRPPSRNPLELGTALLFALVFVLVMVLTTLAREYLGRPGLYSLAALMGITDVDPFILGLAQRGAAATPLTLAAPAVVVAAASNNAVKAVYAYAFADRATGRVSAGLLLALAVLGVVPLLWL